MPLLSIQSLGKRYAGFELFPLSFELEEGQILSLVGESGSGKTTLLRLLAGFESPDCGQIRLKGKNLAFVPPEKRGIGMVFQDYALFPHLNIAKNIAFGLGKLSSGARKARVEEMMNLTGLSSLAQKYPHQLSGGEQQRAALARALAPSPALLLLDEPFSNLDALIHEQLRDELSQMLRKQGTTAIFVTHDVDDACAISDQMLVMYRGRMLQAGCPDELMHAPADPYVARLMQTAHPQLLRLRKEGFKTQPWQGAVFAAENPAQTRLIERREVPGGEEITLFIPAESADKERISRK